MGLCNVEGNLNTAAKLANANIFHAIESAVQETINKFDVIDHADETRNANKRIDLGTIIHSGNLDFVVRVDFAGGVS